MQLLTPNTNGYTIKRIRDIDDVDGALSYFIYSSMPELSKMFGITWQNFDMLGYIRKNGMVLVCYRHNKPIGILMARLFGSVFDPKTKILYQDLLYVNKKGTRAANILFRALIDFGKLNANHIITMITPTANIKGETLERLGFNQLETLYRLEIYK
jgi:hypothetical protein